MANKLIKNTTITWGGYNYQNLVGIQLLCDWLDDPGLYSWVKFESDDAESKGLDDIVAERSDGTLVLYQVKFTVDPLNSDYELTWDWLTKHTSAGQSLIQKWYSAWENSGAEAVHLAALVTNRIPSREFDACLTGDKFKVDFAKISEAVKAELLKQVPAADRLEAFFKDFLFTHSHKHYLQLRETLIDRLVAKQHTTYHGWHSLLNATIDWAVLRNVPAPDGKITFKILLGELDRRRPAPLEQTFYLPPGYEPPSVVFHEQFIADRVSNPGSTSVLWGSPGQGKSTYLSYFCDELQTKKIPYIRHHYFLSLTDVSDRFTLNSVANSLMAQMENFHSQFVTGHTNSPEKLREWIEACAEGYTAIEKPFVVIIDGLDHIWRENAKDVAPLEALFKHLIPVPENCILLLGTQKVSAEQLPTLLVSHVKESDWHELPLMSQASIRKWLEEQLAGNKFEIQPKKPHESIEPIAQLTEAFHDISNGHPLHLTYSIEAMRQIQRVFLPETVLKLPRCPDGNIRSYYATLWARLRYEAKDALHLVAECDFPWPILSLEETLEIPNGIIQSEIRHMLFDSEAGLIPFHGSLPAYINELEEHASRAAALLPKVVTWLSEKSPEYHRWGWLWMYEAKTGSTENLISQPNRDWLIESMAKAYPDGQMERILAMAETTAFGQQKYARAVELRFLKNRLKYGPEHQIDNSLRLDVCALALTVDDYPIKTLSTAFRTAGIGDLLLLGRQYLRVNRIEDAAECARTIHIRLQDSVRAGTANPQTFDSDLNAALELYAATGAYTPAFIQRFFRNENHEGRFSYFVDRVSELRDIDKLLELIPLATTNGMKQSLGYRLLRLAGAESIHLHERPEFSILYQQPLWRCWAELYKPRTFSYVPFSVDASEFNKEHEYDYSSGKLEWFLHSLFFHVVAEVLQSKGAEFAGGSPSTHARPWLNQVFPEIIRCATLAGRLLLNRERPKYNFIFTAFGELKKPKSYADGQDNFTLRRALVAIAKDMFLITSLIEEPRLVSKTEWERASRSPHFFFHSWITDCLNTGVVIVESKVIGEEIERQMNDIMGSISQLNDRADNYLRLCELACKTDGLDEIGNVLLRHALSCILGYGWRKDDGIHHVLDAIETLAPMDTDFAIEMLCKISPIVANIDEITDGDGTRHSVAALAKLFTRYLPNTFVAMYDDALATGEWYYSERIMSVAVPQIVENTVGRKAVATTLWDSESVGEIRQLARSGSLYAEELIKRNSEYLALAPDDLGKEEHADTSIDTDKKHNVDVSQYGPDQLSQLLASSTPELRLRVEETLVGDWLNYWIQAGRGSELLAALRKYVTGEKVPYGLNRIFDVLFPVSYKLEGKVKAYRWLVMAQIQRRGWHEYYAEEEALARFALVAKHYRSKWHEFVADSTIEDISYGGESLTIPHSRLIHLLVLVNELEHAKSIARAMVDSVVREVSDMMLPLPTWFKGN